MKTPGFILRLLTLLTYFFPFIFFFPTCSDHLTLDVAYNKADAIKNERKKSEYDRSVFESLLDSVSSKNGKQVLDEIRARSPLFFSGSKDMNYFAQDFEYYLIMPTNYSLSGIGAVYFHKNILGKTTIAISIGLSLLTLLPGIFLDRRGIGTYFILFNILVVGVFIINCIVSNVSILFGTWILMFLLVAQLRTKNPSPKTSNP